MEAAPRSTGTMWRSTDIRAPTSTLGAGAAADLGGMSSPAPLAAESRCLGKRRLGRDADAREPFDDVAEDHEEARLRHREHLAAFHHAAARPGSRAPLHRRDSVHHFLRGRELVRHATNLTARPGVRDFASDGGVGAGVIPIVPPTTGVGSPPFVVRFCQETRGCALLAVADEEGTVTLADTSRRLPGPASAEYDFRPEAQWVAHDNAIFDVAWCRGDARMLTASGDQTVRLWDVETMVPHRTFRGHHGSVKAVAVQPESGGDVFASCGRDGAIALWDAREGRRRTRSEGHGADGEPASAPAAMLERAHEPPAAMGGGTARARGLPSVAPAARTTRAAARRAAAASTPPNARGNAPPGNATGNASDARSQAVRAEVQRSVTSVAFAHDGQVLVSAGAADGVIKLWDVRRLSRGARGVAEPVGVLVDADVPVEAGGVGVGGGRGTARRRGRGITALALAPRGSSRVAASYSDSHIAVFDLCAPRAPPVCHLRGHRAPSFYVKAAFSPDGTHVASGSCDQRVYVWRVDRPAAPPTALRGHEGEVTAVDWCPMDFTRLASCADDDTARVWSIDRREREDAEDARAEEETRVATDIRRGERDERTFGSSVLRTPAAAREPARAMASARTRTAFEGGEWLARAVEEGRRLEFDTPFAGRVGGNEAAAEDDDDAKENAREEWSRLRNGSDVAETVVPAALLTPGPVAARTRRGGARRQPLAPSQNNSILTYFTPRGDDA